MKWYLRLMVLVFAGLMAFAYAVPDKTSKEDSSVNEQLQDETPSQPVSSAGEEAIGDLLLQAVSLLGVAYRFGGSSPASGLDCSGFIQYVFKKSLKVHLPRTATEMSRLGQTVERSELVPGDLVFFNTRGFAFSHVGIYMGNGKFIHAPRTGKNIAVASLSHAYWQARYNGARRVDRNTNSMEKPDEETRLAEGELPEENAVHPVKRVRCTQKNRRCRRATVKPLRASRAAAAVARADKKRGKHSVKKATAKTTKSRG